MNNCILIATFLFLGTSAISQGGDRSLRSDQPKIVGQLDGESDNFNTFVTIRISATDFLVSPRLESHGSFIQLKLPGTIAPDPGKFFDIPSPVVEKITSFQVDPTTSAVRLFLKQDSQKIMSAIDLDILADRFVVIFDHKKISSLGESLIEEPLSEERTAADVIAKTVVREDIKDPASQLTEPTEASPIDENIRVGLQKAALFSAAMIMLLLIVLTLKRMRKTSQAGKMTKKLPMNLVATHNISPKHQLTLVEVEGEKILLGLAADNVNFLTKIDSKSNKSQAIPPGFHMPPSQPQNPPKQITPKALNHLPQQAKKGEKSVLNGIESNKETEEKDKTVKVYRNLNEDREKAASPRSIEDVRNIIRNRLKDLPS